MSEKKKNKLRTVCLVLFMIYIVAMVYFLIFSDQFGREPYETMRYNLEPFLEIKRFIRYRELLTTESVMLNLVGNVVAFMPFGMLIRWVRNKKTSVFVAFLYSLAFTLCIEWVQLVTKLGVFDVDDIIMNTLGGVLGYIVYWILACIDRRRKKHVSK